MNFDESTHSVAVEPTTGHYPSFDAEGKLVPYKADYSLTEEEKLCFKCTFVDCKENSERCLIKMSKAH